MQKGEQTSRGPKWMIFSLHVEKVMKNTWENCKKLWSVPQTINYYRGFWIAFFLNFTCNVRISNSNASFPINYPLWKLNYSHFQSDSGIFANRWHSLWLQSNQLKFYDFINGGRVIKISVYVYYLPSLTSGTLVFLSIVLAQVNGQFIYLRVCSLES